MMFALAGDVKRTVHELDRATDIELKPGWREFAIAVALTWKGDHEQARTYFAEARVLDGGSYKTEAASIQVIETDAEHTERVRRLREMQPTDPLDFIFQIQVETWLRPKVAIDALENCGRWETSMFAEHLVGLARVNQALLEQNLNAAEAEIANYDRLLGWFRDNRVPLCAKLYTLIAARNIAYYQGDLEKAEKHQISARQVAESLKDASDVFWVARSRAWLFAESGEGTLALAEWEKRTDPSLRGVDPMHFAACIELFGTDEDRRQAIGRLPDAYGASNPHALLAKAYLLALTKATRDQLAAACDQLLACDNSPEMQCGTIEVWLAYGDAFEARERAKSLAKSHARSEDCHWVLVLRYLAGEMEEAEFHTQFEAPMFQAHARYFEGLKRLANGELIEARRCFDDCRRTGRCLANWYWWSKVFLARIEHNDSGLDAN
jgi:tetratricopeptide (TPR) repeat protein